MTNRLNGKTVLVTGATSGIGKSIAEQFAECKCNLILTGRRLDRLKTISEELKKHATDVTLASFDIRDIEECKKFADSHKHKSIDILINNAGLAKRNGFSSIWKF